MKKFITLLSAFLISCTSGALAAQNGDIIGNIYSTDIIADIDGAPIRSFSLDGKTAIIVEDLKRYGFEVGYNDYLRALYACVLENTFSAYPDTVERGVCGSIVGQIYHSDITTSINGVDVPCFSLNGEMAVAIEDIGGDITQEYRSDTGMMYKWNAENRTISLLPDYDNGVQANIVFNQYNASPYIENGILKYSRALSQSDIPATIPEGAFKYPIRWGNENGEIVGYAYDSAKNEPIQYEDGTWEMTSTPRIVTHFDIDALYRLTASENIKPISHEEILKHETELLTTETSAPSEYKLNQCTILQNADKITLICNNEYGATAVRSSDFPAIQITRERPASDEYEFIKAEEFSSDDSSVNGYMFTYKTKTGRIYSILAHEPGYFKYFEAIPRETDIGTLYSYTSIAPGGPSGMIDAKAQLTVDGNTRTVPALISNSAIINNYVPAKDIAVLLGGSAQISEDGFALEITTDGKAHAITCTNDLSGIALPPNPLEKTLFSCSSESPLSIFPASGITINGEKISTQVKRTVSTAGMSMREITLELPVKIYGGTAYINIELIQNLYK